MQILEVTGCWWSADFVEGSQRVRQRKLDLDELKDPSVDKGILRKGQAGFLKETSGTEQIFTRRNIIEQCMELQAPLHLNFIDFEKDFDSLHRVTL